MAECVENVAGDRRDEDGDDRCCGRGVELASRSFTSSLGMVDMVDMVIEGLGCSGHYGFGFAKVV